jgi:hypothetical protein
LLNAIIEYSEEDEWELDLDMMCIS